MYEKANPALYSSNGVQSVNSVSLVRDRLRRDKDGKLATPANSWVCRIGSDYHLLPRGKKTAGSSIANTLEMTNAQLLKTGDPLTLLEPHTTLSTAGLAAGAVVTLTVEGVGTSYTIATGAVSVKNQVADFINNSSILGSKIYAIVADTAPDLVHIFAKGMKPYTISSSGAVVADSILVAARPIGTVLLLSTQANNYDFVTVTPSTAPNAIAVADVPNKAVIDAPVYNEIVGLFNDVLSFEQASQYLIAPIHGAAGMNVFALSHFDECLRQMFPKITFVENRN